MRVCSLLATTARLGNYDTIYIPKYDMNGTPKAQAFKRKSTNRIGNKIHVRREHNSWAKPNDSN